MDLDFLKPEAVLPSLDARCLICGPPALVRDVSEGLTRMGVGPDAILVERYE